jgi:hypothetical protein
MASGRMRSVLSMCLTPALHAQEANKRFAELLDNPQRVHDIEMSRDQGIGGGNLRLDSDMVPESSASKGGARGKGAPASSAVAKANTVSNDVHAPPTSSLVGDGGGEQERKMGASRERFLGSGPLQQQQQQIRGDKIVAKSRQRQRSGVSSKVGRGSKSRRDVGLVGGESSSSISSGDLLGGGGKKRRGGGGGDNLGGV